MCAAIGGVVQPAGCHAGISAGHLAQWPRCRAPDHRHEVDVERRDVRELAAAILLQPAVQIVVDHRGGDRAALDRGPKLLRDAVPRVRRRQRFEPAGETVLQKYIVP